MPIVTDLPKLPDRDPESHKGDFGKVLIVAGSLGMAGAASLAGQAALRSGSGLVRIATPASCLATVAALNPCYTTLALPEDAQGRISEKAIPLLLEAITEHDAVALGPGLGQSRALVRLVEQIIAIDSLALVIDADGLNNLSKIKQWPKHCQARLILTPHPGEMQRLWSGLNRMSMPVDRSTCATQFSQQTKTTVVLKGAGTVVTDAQRIYINTTGNPGMATAGSGDVLTGIILSLLGQKLCRFDAASLGVNIHGAVGDCAARDLGPISLTALDLVDFLPKAWKKHHDPT